MMPVENMILQDFVQLATKDMHLTDKELALYKNRQILILDALFGTGKIVSASNVLNATTDLLLETVYLSAMTAVLLTTQETVSAVTRDTECKTVDVPSSSSLSLI